MGGADSPSVAHGSARSRFPGTQEHPTGGPEGQALNGRSGMLARTFQLSRGSSKRLSSHPAGRSGSTGRSLAGNRLEHATSTSSSRAAIAIGRDCSAREIRACCPSRCGGGDRRQRPTTIGSGSPPTLPPQATSSTSEFGRGLSRGPGRRVGTRRRLRDPADPRWLPSRLPRGFLRRGGRLRKAGPAHRPEARWTEQGGEHQVVADRGAERLSLREGEGSVEAMFDSFRLEGLDESFQVVEGGLDPISRAFGR